MKKYFTDVFGADLRSLAALRIGCGLLILSDLLQRSTDLVVHYTDYGIAPRTLVMEHSSSRWYVSLHYMSGVWEVQALLFVVAGVAAMALLVGYRTQLASVLSWALFVSLCVRNPYIVQGGDMLLRVVLFWGMFLPWGGAYSVDRAWRDERSIPLTQRYVSWGTAAYVIQIVSMYWFTVALKSGPQWWREGSAIYYALNIDYLVTPIGKLLLDLPNGLLKISTWGVVLFEIVGPLLLLTPVRKGWVRLYTTICFMLLHLVFLVCFFIGIFPLIGIICMAFFLPPVFWDRLQRRLASPETHRVEVYYDQDCGFCLRTVRLIETFFFPNIEIAGAQTVLQIEAEMRQRNFWVVLDARGERHFAYDAVVVVAAVSPLLRPFVPLLRLGVARWCGERLYRHVATHRQTSCQVPRGLTADVGPFAKLRVAIVNAALIGLVLYVFILNLSTLPDLKMQIPDTVRSVSTLIGLDQVWNMFAPFPAKDDGWYVIPGRLRNGRIVDLFRGGKEVSFSKPAYASLEFKNHHWRKYMDLLRKRDPLPPAYARYLCREWNRRHHGAETLEELEIIYVLEWTQPPADYSPVQKQSVYKAECRA